MRFLDLGDFQVDPTNCLSVIPGKIQDTLDFMAIYCTIPLSVIFMKWNMHSLKELIKLNVFHPGCITLYSLIVEIMSDHLILISHTISLGRKSVSTETRGKFILRILNILYFK